MKFDMKEAIEALERTPQSLKYFLSGLSDVWLLCNEGEGTWNASEVAEHGPDRPGNGGEIQRGRRAMERILGYIEKVKMMFEISRG